jgi:HAMP domain-containing protein
MKRRSLTLTLIISFLALSLSILILSNGIETYFSFISQQSMMSEHQNLVAQSAADKVENYIREKIALLESVSRVTNIMNGETQTTPLEKLMGMEPSFRQLMVLDTEGEEVSSVSRLSSLTFWNINKQFKEDMLHYAALGEIYISDIYIDNITNEPMTIIAVPINDVLGNFKGVLASELNLKFMWDVVGSMKIGTGGLAYVIDRKGHLIAFNDISRVLAGEDMTHLDKVKEFMEGNSTHTSTSDVSIGILGSEVLSTYAPLLKPDWAVVVEIPTSEAYSDTFQIIKLTIWIVIFSVAIAFLIGIYLSRRISRPIVMLRDAANEIGNGVLDKKIDIKSNNEVGELASAFEKMRSSLKDSRKDLEKNNKTLEKKVSKRTGELQSKIYELERFNKVAVGRELRMIELKKRIRELEERK